MEKQTKKGRAASKPGLSKKTTKEARVAAAKVVQEPPTPEGIKHLTPEQTLNAKRILIKHELEKRQGNFLDLLPKHIPVAKFIGVVMNACLTNTNLLQCTPTSIITSAIRAAQLGLLPDPLSGEAHLIPFYNPKKNNLLEAQFLPGYRGLVSLAMRSGQVKRFQPRIVFEGDIFDYEYGTEEYIKHKPQNKSIAITNVYAVIEFVNGGKMFDIMSLDEIIAVRDEAPEWKRTPAKDKDRTFWGARFPDMAKKTVIRRLSKYAPISPEFQYAVGLDEKVEVIGESQIDIENINWDELTPEQQENLLQELLKNDQEKKDLLLAGVISEQKSRNGKRSADLMQQTENLINNL